MKTVHKNVGTILKNRMIPIIDPIEYKDLKARRVHGILQDRQRFFISQDRDPMADVPNPL
jgi:hypothetical protein